MVKIRLVKHITRKKSPYRNKTVRVAHQIANKAEKKADPVAYRDVNKLDRKLGKNQYSGENTRSSIEVSRQLKPTPAMKSHGMTTKRLRKSTALHERVERAEKKKRGFF